MFKNLANRLDGIALGNFYDGEALRIAYELEKIITHNDRQVLSRYMHGSETQEDRFKLQQICINLREVKKC